MTTIYYSSLSRENHDRLLEDYLPETSTTFRNRVSRYSRWQDAQLSLLGRLLLKHGFGVLNETFQEDNLSYTEYDKPFFKDHQLKFNISHSGDLAICAITDSTSSTDVGIDIEIMKNIEIEDFKLQMTNEEWTEIDTARIKGIAFYNYWTRKEAVIKAHGMGMSIPLKSFEIVDNHTFINNEDFFLTEIGLARNYKCHLAFKGDADTDVCEPQRVEF